MEWTQRDDIGADLPAPAPGRSSCLSDNENTVSIQLLSAKRTPPRTPVAGFRDVAQLQHRRGNCSRRALAKPISSRPAGDPLCRRQDGIRIEAVVTVELGDGARLAEML